MKGSDLVVEMEGRSNRPGSEVMSRDPTTLAIENSNIAEGACLTTENTSEGVAIEQHAAACRYVMLVNMDHTRRRNNL